MPEPAASRLTDIFLRVLQAEPSRRDALIRELCGNDAALTRDITELVAAAERAKQVGRFAETCDPMSVATQLWAAGHGLIMLVLTGVLPIEVVAPNATGTAAALFVAAGDEPERCRRSVAAGWAMH